MAPFPETEIMTIKRLEVALRKMDLKLLKDGAYKLHEKYHSGFKFEYIDLLKEIFIDVTNNPSIPNDIKDILTPTIDDILSSQGVKTDTSTSPYEALKQNRVSSLTSLSYSTGNEQQEAPHQPPKQNAFEAFSPKTTAQPRILKQSPFSAQPFKEFVNPMVVEYPKEENNAATSIVEDVQNNESVEKIEENANIETKAQASQPTEQEYLQNNVKNENQVEIQQQSMTKQKSIAIFYNQDSSKDKNKNIQKYRELIKNYSNASMGEILSLLSEINVQADTNVVELKGILEQLNNTNNYVSLITNSQSANFVQLMETNKISYSIFNPRNDKKINLMPIFGLSDLFECSQCHQEFLETEKETKAFVLQCPKCKSPMFPSYYAQNDRDIEINLDYYNMANIAFANSQVWLVIHPSIDDKITINLLRSALKVSNQVEEIYIIDKDINVRETYKTLFNEINQNIKINTQVSVIEDFLKAVY